MWKQIFLQCKIPGWFQGWAELSPRWNIFSPFRAACWEAPARLSCRISVPSHDAIACKRPAVPRSGSCPRSHPPDGFFWWAPPKKSSGVGPQNRNFACSKKIGSPQSTPLPVPSRRPPPPAGLSSSTKPSHRSCEFRLLRWLGRGNLGGGAG